ncbi:MAG: hypothetical protein V3V74_07755 [Nitrosomonadaceae bacterium]
MARSMKDWRNSLPKERQEKIEKRYQELRRNMDDFFEQLKELRGTQKLCDNCFGAGSRFYPSTSGWRGGIAGQAVTSDVCDTCWGSGDSERPWLDLRKLCKVLTPEQIRELQN